MSRHNPVFQVLVTQNNKEVLGGNKTLGDLLPGQIGIFDYHTNLSLDGSKKVRDFYLAVGVDEDNDGMTDNVLKSRGSHIQAKNVTSFTFRPYTPGREQIIKLKNYSACCDREYGIKIDFSNEIILRQQGFTPYVKTYAMKTECCNGCKQICPKGDDNQITKEIYTQIANDKDSFIKVSIIPRGDVSKAGVTPVEGKLTVSDLEAIMAYNAKQEDSDDFVHTDLQFETISSKAVKACGINTKHTYPLNTFIRISKVGDFSCTGEIEEVQKAVVEEGSGVEVRQLEVFARGWDVSPYRVSSIDGLAFEDATYLSNQNTKYDMIYLGFEQESDGAWKKYEYGQGLHIAIPCADSVTRDSLVSLLDKLQIVQFDALLDDAQNADIDPAVVESTSAIDDVNKDGLA